MGEEKSDFLSSILLSLFVLRVSASVSLCLCLCMGVGTWDVFVKVHKRVRGREVGRGDNLRTYISRLFADEFFLLP